MGAAKHNRLWGAWAVAFGSALRRHRVRSRIGPTTRFGTRQVFRNRQSDTSATSGSTKHQHEPEHRNHKNNTRRHTNSRPTNTKEHQHADHDPNGGQPGDLGTGQEHHAGEARHGEDRSRVSAQTNTGTSGATSKTEPTHTPKPIDRADSRPPQPARPRQPNNTRRHPMHNDQARRVARSVTSVADPAMTVQSAEPVAVFARRATLAAAIAERMGSPRWPKLFVGRTSQPTVAAAPGNPLRAVKHRVRA